MVYYFTHYTHEKTEALGEEMPCSRAISALFKRDITLYLKILNVNLNILAGL